MIKTKRRHLDVKNISFLFPVRVLKHVKDAIRAPTIHDNFSKDSRAFSSDCLKVNGEKQHGKTVSF